MATNAKNEIVNPLLDLIKENEALAAKISEMSIKSEQARKMQGAVDRALQNVINGQGNIIDKMTNVGQVCADVKDKTAKVAQLQTELKLELTNKIYLQHAVWKEISELRALLGNDKNPVKLIVREFQLAAKELHHMGIIQSELMENLSVFKKVIHEEMVQIRSEMVEIINFMQDGLTKKIKLAFQAQVKLNKKEGSDGGDKEVARPKHISEKGFTASEEEVLESLEKTDVKSAIKAAQEPEMAVDTDLAEMSTYVEAKKDKKVANGQSGVATQQEKTDLETPPKAESPEGAAKGAPEEQKGPAATPPEGVKAESGEKAKNGQVTKSTPAKEDAGKKTDEPKST